MVGFGAHGEGGGGDAGGDVYQCNIIVLGEVAEVLHQLVQLGQRQVGKLVVASAASDEGEALRCGGENVAQGELAAEVVGEVALGGEVELDVGVGEAGVAIEHQDFFTLFGQLGGEVEGEGGFADAAFTGGDGEDGGFEDSRVRGFEEEVHGKDDRMLGLWGVRKKRDFLSETHAAPDSGWVTQNA